MAYFYCLFWFAVIGFSLAAFFASDDWEKDSPSDDIKPIIKFLGGGINVLYIGAYFSVLDANFFMTNSNGGFAIGVAVITIFAFFIFSTKWLEDRKSVV